MPRRLHMFMTSALTLAATAAAAFADDKAAQGHAGEHEVLSAIPSPNQGVITSITALVVFAVVFAILALKVWPVIAKGLDERAGKIREEIAAAEKARKDAREALEKYEKSLADAHAEAQKMLERTRAQQQALAEDLKAKADAELGAMRERARQDIEAAKRAALQEIYTHTATVATAVAAKILRREVNAGDQKRLVEEVMGTLAASKA